MKVKHTLLLTVLSVALAACGSGGGSGDSNSNSNSNSSSNSSSPAPNNSSNKKVELKKDKVTGLSLQETIRFSSILMKETIILIN